MTDESKDGITVLEDILSELRFQSESIGDIRAALRYHLRGLTQLIEKMDVEERKKAKQFLIDIGITGIKI